MAQLSIKIAAEQRKADAEMFQILAEAIGRNNVALSAKSEWSKENNQHNFVELLAFYRHQLLPVNPSSIAAVKDAATYDTCKGSYQTSN